MGGGIRVKVISLAVACVALTGVAMTGVSAWRSDQFAVGVRGDLSHQVEESINQTVLGIGSVVSSQSDRVIANMNVATATLARAGGLRFGAGSVTWSAKNQATNEVTRISLSPALAGSTWLGQQSSLTNRVPVVDEVKARSGARRRSFNG
jgi:hypothetical protein